jgi:hypothetical protein
MLHDKHGSRKIPRQGCDKLGERFHASGRRSNDDDSLRFHSESLSVVKTNRMNEPEERSRRATVRWNSPRDDTILKWSVCSENGSPPVSCPPPSGDRTVPEEKSRCLRTPSNDGCVVFLRPDLQRAFGQPGKQKLGCGFPVAQVLALFHAGSGILERVLLAPWRTHDTSRVSQVRAAPSLGDVLAADHGFCSFAHLALLLKAGLHGVFRVHQRIVVDFRSDGCTCRLAPEDRTATNRAFKNTGRNLTS